MKIPPREKRITRATIITLIRIACIPFIILLIQRAEWYYAMLIFGMASITDYLDGNIARWCNERTVLGALLDPVADKLLVLLTTGALFFHKNVPFVIPFWFVATIFIKEICIIFGSLYLCAMHCMQKIQPTIFGKLATVVQMGALLRVLFLYNTQGSWQQASLFLYSGVFFTVLATVQYAYLGYSCTVKKNDK